MNDNVLQIVISALDKTKEAFTSVQKQMSGLASGASGLQDKLKQMQPAFKQMALVGGAAFTAIAGEATLSIKAFSESQKQLKQVDAIVATFGEKTLKSFGGSFKNSEQAVSSATKTITDFGAKMQSLGGISDEVASVGLAKLVQITGNYQKAQEAAMLAADLSIYKNLDYSSAVDIVGKVLSGNLGILSRYGIQLKENATVEEAIAELTGRTAGQYETYGKTVEGQTKILKETFGDLQETIGNTLAPILTDLLGKITPIIKKVTDWINENKELTKHIIVVAGALSGFVLTIGTTGIALNALITATKTFSTALGISQIALVTVTSKIALIITAIVAVTAVVIKFKDQIALCSFTLRGWALTVEQSILGLFRMKGAYEDVSRKIEENNLKIESYKNKIKESSEKVDNLSQLQKNLTGSIDDSIEAMGEFGDETEKVMGLTKEQFNDVISTAKELESKMKDINKELADLDKNYQKQSLSDREDFEESVAKIVVEAERKRNKLTTELHQKQAEGASDEEINRLSMQLAEQQRILETYAQMNMGIEDEVEEYRAYMQMNELQQLEFNYKKKELLREREMLTEKLNKLQELVDATEQYNAIIGIFGKEKEAFVKKEIEKTKTFGEQLEAQKTLLGNWKDSVVAVYDNLVGTINAKVSQIRSPAAAISNVSGVGISSISGLGYGGGGVGYASPIIGFQEGTPFVPATGLYQLHKGEAVIPANKKSGIVVNINGGYYLSREAAEDIGNKIVDKLKMQFNL